MKKNNNKILKKKIFNFFKKKSLYLKDIEKKTKENYKKKNQNRYLYKNKKLKKGIFLKRPKLNEIFYPFFLNMKLIKTYLKKK